MNLPSAGQNHVFGAPQFSHFLRFHILERYLIIIIAKDFPPVYRNILLKVSKQIYSNTCSKYKKVGEILKLANQDKCFHSLTIDI